MSFAEYGPIAGLIGRAYDELSAMSTPRLVLFLAINIPILSIVFNVIYQLVCVVPQLIIRSPNLFAVA